MKEERKEGKGVREEREEGGREMGGGEREERKGGE